tara:strand:+ start:53 stop:295 length:243 start_codon:yes stop_codon:yes gene_type:complete
MYELQEINLRKGSPSPVSIVEDYITGPLARELRDAFLAETDWTANSDVTMTVEMTTYRQALRDITGQDGFPENITWPTKP